MLARFPADTSGTKTVEDGPDDTERNQKKDRHLERKPAKREKEERHERRDKRERNEMRQPDDGKKHNEEKKDETPIELHCTSVYLSLVSCPHHGLIFVKCRRWIYLFVV